MSAPDPVAVGAEIEALIASLRQVSGPAAATDAQRLVRLVMSFYGAGLSRMLDIVRADSGGSRPLIERLASDPLVASLLTLHDLQPRSADAGLIQITRSNTTHRHQESSGSERCELCGIPLTEEHAHLVDIESRRVLCACRMCSAVGGRYRLLPSRYLHLPQSLTAPEWETLGIPVGLVFFVTNSRLARTVASYPGPAGATESLLPLDTWAALSVRNPWLQRLAPDVEALLVRRVNGEYRCYIVPLDVCYQRVGRIRKAWTGMGGGELVEREIEAFFTGVHDKARQHAEALA